jgi:predicted nucleic acid-binding protein
MGAMIPRLLLDTVILVDHLNGVSAATRWLRALKSGEAVISVITRAEVLAGADEAERDDLLDLLDGWRCLDITPEVADLAASLRRAHRWKLPDAFQAALAEHHGLKLATRNTKDFDPKRHGFVKVPYRLG